VSTDAATNARAAAAAARIPPNPVSAAAAAALRVVRDGSTGDRDATVLVTSLQTWVQYASTAPPTKLRPLRVVASGGDRVLVRGTPLPPLAGRRYVEREGVALPSGFGFSPATDAAAVRALLGSDPQSLLLFHEDGTCERFDAGEFAPASVAAGRRSV
jgi:hypothetical protein